MKRRIVLEELLKKNKTSLGRIIVLTGARQTGKTTLAKYCFPDYAYLSIDDHVQKENYLKMTASQWKAFYSQAILDEVQKAPDLIDTVKSVYDQFDEPRYILLGSSQFLLMEKVRESLAGRCLIVEIYPLTLPELRTSSFEETVTSSFFASYMRNETSVDELMPSFVLDPVYAVKLNTYNFYLQYGSYPAITNESLKDEERREWLTTYVRTFLERDIRDLVSFRDLEPFIKLQRYLANTSGSLVNYSSMAKETGVSLPTIQRYIRYMEISYQAVVLPAWFSNPIKNLIKSPKVHFMDQGILQAILKKTGFPTGNEYESAIVAEIYKQIKTFHLPVNCYHIRTKDGREVDLLLETADFFIAIEIKMTEHVSHTDARHLTGLQEILNKPLKYCFILSNDNEVHYFGDNIIAMHAAMFLT